MPRLRLTHTPFADLVAGQLGEPGLAYVITAHPRIFVHLRRDDPGDLLAFHVENFSTTIGENEARAVFREVLGTDILDRLDELPRSVAKLPQLDSLSDEEFENALRTATQEINADVADAGIEVRMARLRALRDAGYPLPAAELGEQLPEQPSSLSVARWEALLASFSEWLGGLIEVRPPVARALRAASAATVQPRAFGRGVAIVPIGERLDAVTLKISAAALGELADGPLLVVLQNEGGEILASHEFERISGMEAVEVAVDAAAATADDVMMILARPPKRGDHGEPA